jgi:exopolyphosphatase/pppGpp-phosphohydrolase
VDPRGILVMDPGGDSTEICADPSGASWETAAVASLPFGSVSLQERFGGARDNEPLAWPLLEAVAGHSAAVLRSFDAARPFLGLSLTPAIRMNPPIQAALERVNGRPAAAHGGGGLYAVAELEALTRAAAGMDHAGRAALMAGEPLGKVDRTCYGFASWLGVLKGLGAGHFLVEPWGIKLGAALFLNRIGTPEIHG